MYFDAKKAKALAPDEYYAIDGCPGLRLMARLSKKTWVYRYRSPVTKKLKTIKIGSWPAMSVIEAANAWQDLRTRRESGEDMAVEKRQARYEVKIEPDHEFTLADVVQAYYDGHLAKNRKPAGAHATHLRLKNAIAGHEGLLVSKVSRRFVHDLISGLSENPTIAKSVRTEMAAGWELAINSGRVSSELPNWWLTVKFTNLKSKGALRDGKRKGTSKRVLRPEELAYLFTHQMHLFSEGVQDFLTLQLWTCTRGGEICQMHKDHFSVGEDGQLWWTVPKELTKGLHHESATDLRVPLVGRALKVVERRLAALKPQDGGWLFASKSRAGVRTYVKQPYMQSKVHYRQPYSNCRPDHIRERLRVIYWSPHDLRRTGRTMLASMGCPEEVAEAILGHVKPGVVGVYNLYKYDAERREWLTKLDAELARITEASWPQYCPAEAVRR